MMLEEGGKMSDLEMTIEQGDNGWILTFIGHDSKEKTIVCKKWTEVIQEADDYFGWYDSKGNPSKNPC